MFKFNFHPEDQTDSNNDNEQLDTSDQEIGDFYVDDLNGILARTPMLKLQPALLDESPVDAEQSRKKFEAYQSDLVPSVYEGGFKTWECSYDLADYLQSILDSYSNPTRVLEIGCGSGLPGLQLNAHSQFCVDFQDFNREVVEQTGKQLKKVKKTYNNRLFFGDWAELIQLIPSKHYDILLTSETIYNVSSYRKLVKLFDHTLKPQGAIYLAAKVHYFGVQGGTRQFEEFIRKDGTFTSRVVRVIDANVKREILQLTRLTH